MAELISIRERILRQIALNLGDMPEVGTVYRFDARGSTTYAALAGFVNEGDESAEPGAMGNPGTTIKTLAVLVALQLFADETASETTSMTRNRWIGRIERHFMEDVSLREKGSGDQLSEDLRVTAVPGPDYTEGDVSPAVLFEVRYQHDVDNPYQLTGVIAALTE